MLYDDNKSVYNDLSSLYNIMYSDHYTLYSIVIYHHYTMLYNDL